MKNKVSVIAAISILFICLVSYFFPFLKTESTEGRTLATFGMVVHPETGSVTYRESPVERLDAALSDQFLFREQVVKSYLKLVNGADDLTQGIAMHFAEGHDDRYVLHAIGDYELIGNTGYITAMPQTEPIDQSVMLSRTDQLEYLHENYPELKMYVYYVTQAYDTDWFDDSIGAETADHYREIIDAVPQYVRCGRLTYKDLDDYMNIHFRTDHHLNLFGSERVYEDIYVMMMPDFELGGMREPVSVIRSSEDYDYAYLGSYGRSLRGLYEGFDDFFFHEYDLPERQCAVLDPDTFEEKEVLEIGLYDEYINGSIDRSTGTDHYIIMYGTAVDDAGNEYDDKSYPFVIRNSEGCGRNLLITGDSHARAVRDELASHFDTTVYLDYRMLSRVPVDRIIEEYDIDVLLICSHTSMWASEEYLYTFAGDE